MRIKFNIKDNMENNFDNIKQVFNNHNIFLENATINKFCILYNELIDFNNKINITSIVELNDVVIKHFIDSILIYDYFKLNSTVIDIGCGGGFPSIPLMIVRPDLNFTLVDSVGKKLLFVKDMIKKLCLSNCSILHARIEDIAHNMNYRNNFDYVISRSLAKLNELIEYSIPFLKINGTAIAYKGKDYKSEIDICDNALSCLNAKIKTIISKPLDKDILRYFIIIEKLKNTKIIYPRQNNKIRKNSL